jgi:hypothetical protein
MMTAAISLAIFRDAVVGGPEGDLVGQRRALTDHLVLGHFMPDREQDLAAVDRHRHESVKLVRRPALCEEGRGEDDQTEATPRYPGIDLAAEAVAQPQLELVIPEREAPLAQAEASGRTSASLSSDA